VACLSTTTLSTAMAMTTTSWTYILEHACRIVDSLAVSCRWIDLECVEDWSIRIVGSIETPAHHVGEVRTADDQFYNFTSDFGWKVHSVPHVDYVLVVVGVLDVSEPVVRHILDVGPRDWHNAIAS
jgi:hypothetical protein